jgi:hypothetical protein
MADAEREGSGTNPGIEFLQTAALQLIGAAKIFLDAAEHVVRDPKSVGEAAATLKTLAKFAVDMVAAQANKPSSTASPAPDEPIEAELVDLEPIIVDPDDAELLDDEVVDAEVEPG